MASLLASRSLRATSALTDLGKPTFKGLRPGQFVRYNRYAGMGLRGPEYKAARSKVVMAFEGHVVVNAGGAHGTPVVVDEKNYLG